MKATFDIEAALKAQQWERAKGELRALVALQGAHKTSGLGPPNTVADETRRWQNLEKAVEEFVKIVEDNGLQE